MSDPPRTSTRNDPSRVHERPPDPAEAADRPLEPKEALDPLADAGASEPGAGAAGPRPDPPHHELTNPVGEPDLTKDSDPYQPEPEDGSAAT